MQITQIVIVVSLDITYILLTLNVSLVRMGVQYVYQKTIVNNVIQVITF